VAPSKNIADGTERLKRFRKIILEHPRLGNIRNKIAWLLATTADVVTDNELRREAAKGRSIKFEELWVLPIFGPSGSMKSTSIRKIVDEINSNPDIPGGDIPVVVVSLREVKNTRAFLVSNRSIHRPRSTRPSTVAFPGWRSAARAARRRATSTSRR
jgi:hypothetical protein